MKKMLLHDETDVRDFARGCTLLGTGGGGLEENGIESLLSELEAGHEIGWVDANEIEDEALTACTFLMGSIAPHTEEVVKEMESYGLNNNTSKYKEKDRLVQAVKELESFTGKKIDAIVPIELGGANTCAGVATAAACGILAVDGDYTGRAIPEIQQTTPYLKDKVLWPVSSVDEWGDVAFIKDAINYRVVEKLGKKISEPAYGLSGDAGFLMSGKDMKDCIIKGDLTKCYNVGKMIREAGESGKDPVSAIIDELDGYLILEGTLTGKETEDKEGYYWGYHTVTGTKNDNGHIAKIWFKNENHACWYDDQVVATSPDSIVVVDAKTGMPYSNPKLAIGMEVAVIAIPAMEFFRTEKGVAILGPKYFGLNIEYIPIEKRIQEIKG